MSNTGVSLWEHHTNSVWETEGHRGQRATWRPGRCGSWRHRPDVGEIVIKARDAATSSPSCCPLLSRSVSLKRLLISQGAVSQTWFTKVSCCFVVPPTREAVGGSKLHSAATNPGVSHSGHDAEFLPTRAPPFRWCGAP